MKFLYILACVFVSEIGSAFPDDHLAPVGMVARAFYERELNAELGQLRRFNLAYSTAVDDVARAATFLTNTRAAYSEAAAALTEITSNLEQYKSENALLLSVYYQRSNQLNFYQNQTATLERYLMYGQRIVMQESDDFIAEFSSYLKRLDLNAVSDELEYPDFAIPSAEGELVVAVVKDFAQENNNLNGLGFELREAMTTVPGMLYAALIVGDKLLIEKAIDKVNSAIVLRKQNFLEQKAKIIDMGVTFKLLDELETKLKLALNAMDAANVNLTAATAGARLASETSMRAKNERDEFKLRLETKRRR